MRFKTLPAVAIVLSAVLTVSVCAGVFWQMFGLDFYPVPDVSRADVEALMRECKSLAAESAGNEDREIPGSMLAKYPTICRLKPYGVMARRDRVVLIYGAHGRGLYVEHNVEASKWVYRNQAKNVDGVSAPRVLEIPDSAL
jgi:hypothetical protein